MSLRSSSQQPPVIHVKCNRLQPRIEPVTQDLSPARGTARPCRCTSNLLVAVNAKLKTVTFTHSFATTLTLATLFGQFVFWVFHTRASYFSFTDSTTTRFHRIGPKWRKGSCFIYAEVLLPQNKFNFLYDIVSQTISRSLFNIGSNKRKN